jgi:hypothetical protein
MPLRGHCRAAGKDIKVRAMRSPFLGAPDVGSRATLLPPGTCQREGESWKSRAGIAAERGPCPHLQGMPGEPNEMPSEGYCPLARADPRLQMSLSTQNRKG